MHCRPDFGSTISLSVYDDDSWVRHGCSAQARDRTLELSSPSARTNFDERRKSRDWKHYVIVLPWWGRWDKLCWKLVTPSLLTRILARRRKKKKKTCQPYTRKTSKWLSSANCCIIPVYYAPAKPKRWVQHGGRLTQFQFWLSRSGLSTSFCSLPAVRSI